MQKKYMYAEDASEIADAIVEGIEGIDLAKMIRSELDPQKNPLWHVAIRYELRALRRFAWNSSKVHKELVIPSDKQDCRSPLESLSIGYPFYLQVPNGIIPLTTWMVQNSHLASLILSLPYIKLDIVERGYFVYAIPVQFKIGTIGNKVACVIGKPSSWFGNSGYVLSLYVPQIEMNKTMSHEIGIIAEPIPDVIAIKTDVVTLFEGVLPSRPRIFSSVDVKREVVYHLTPKDDIEDIELPEKAMIIEDGKKS